MFEWYILENIPHILNTLRIHLNLGNHPHFALRYLLGKSERGEELNDRPISMKVQQKYVNSTRGEKIGVRLGVAHKSAVGGYEIVEWWGCYYEPPPCFPQQKKSTTTSQGEKLKVKSPSL